jgi:NTE family protein
MDELFERYASHDVDGDRRDAHLVISGSGMRLYAFLLAIYVLHLLGYRFTKVTGTSGGAIVAAGIAAFYDPSSSRAERRQALRKVAAMTMRIDVPRLLDPQWFFWRIAFKLTGLIKGKKILKKLRAEFPATFAELKMPCEIATFQVNIADPRTHLLTDGDLPLAVRASMSIPFVFSPVQHGDMLLVDGGWQMNLALPVDGKDVIALAFEVGDDERPQSVPNNLALGFKLIDGAIDEGVRRAVAGCPEASLVKLVTGLKSLDFFVDDKKKMKALSEGADSVLRWAGKAAP